MARLCNGKLIKRTFVTLKSHICVRMLVLYIVFIISFVMKEIILELTIKNHIRLTFTTSSRFCFCSDDAYPGKGICFLQLGLVLCDWIDKIFQSPALLCL